MLYKKVLSTVVYTLGVKQNKKPNKTSPPLKNPVANRAYIISDSEGFFVGISLVAKGSGAGRAKNLGIGDKSRIWRSQDLDWAFSHLITSNTPCCSLDLSFPAGDL